MTQLKNRVMQRLQNQSYTYSLSVLIAMGTGFFLGVLATLFIAILLWGN